MSQNRSFHIFIYFFGQIDKCLIFGYFLEVALTSLAHPPSPKVASELRLPVYPKLHNLSTIFFVALFKDMSVYLWQSAG